MDLPGGYQGNFSLIAASLPLFCCSAGNPLFPVYHLILSLVPQLHLQAVASQRQGTTWGRTVKTYSPIYGPPLWDLPRLKGWWKGRCLTHGCEGSAVSLPFTSGLHLSWPQWRKQAQHIIWSLLDRGHGWSTLSRRAWTTATQKILLFEF